MVRFQMKIRSILLESRANVILVIKRQKTLLNCDLVFFGRSILEVTNLDI